mmetsp:Transcript_9760/g.22389  ORF Transcript_9760/g.22389 Transcript_9760/m.22389 type:complete len:267 (+) Transcript_9760:262-1062(+)
MSSANVVSGASAIGVGTLLANVVEATSSNRPSASGSTSVRLGLAARLLVAWDMDSSSSSMTPARHAAGASSPMVSALGMRSTAPSARCPAARCSSDGRRGDAAPGLDHSARDCARTGAGGRVARGDTTPPSGPTTGSDPGLASACKLPDDGGRRRSTDSELRRLVLRGDCLRFSSITFCIAMAQLDCRLKDRDGDPPGATPVSGDRAPPTILATAAVAITEPRRAREDGGGVGSSPLKRTEDACRLDAWVAETVVRLRTFLTSRSC